MLNKLNFMLIVAITIFAIYAIILNFNIDDNSKRRINFEENLYKNTQINNQLKLELIRKTSNIFVDKFAREKLEMHLPKKIYTLD